MLAQLTPEQRALFDEQQRLAGEMQQMLAGLIASCRAREARGGAAGRCINCVDKPKFGGQGKAATPRRATRP